MVFAESTTPEYKRITTGDNSPTLALPPTWEPMHALEGAFTETLYIYQPTVERALAQIPNPHLISVGLGLGYNELLISAESLKQKKSVGGILSYEAVSFLTENFTMWLNGATPALSDIYDDILNLFAKKYELNAFDIKTNLSNLLKEGTFKVLGPMESSPHERSHAILFDAFSKKTSPELWDETFLENFFSTATQPTCFLSTYACSGVLKRSLVKNGFTLNIIKGYAKKKESTFAEKLQA